MHLQLQHFIYKVDNCARGEAAAGVVAPPPPKVGLNSLNLLCYCQATCTWRSHDSIEWQWFGQQLLISSNEMYAQGMYHHLKYKLWFEYDKISAHQSQGTSEYATLNMLLALTTS